MQLQKHTRAEQARINGAKSTGATTLAGLQKCRLASVKHGGYVAATAVLPGENAQKFEGLYDSLVDQYAPRNLAELHIVSAIADAIWRQRRLTFAAQLEIQRQMYALGFDPASDNPRCEEFQLDAEVNSAAVTRLEARARHQTREIARLQRILQSMQKHDVSDEASRKSMEILAASVQKLEAAENFRRPSAADHPPLPAKLPPHFENRHAEVQKQPHG